MQHDDRFQSYEKHTEIAFETENIIIVHDPEGWSSIILGGGGGGKILINVFEFPIFSASWYFSNKYFPKSDLFFLLSQVNLAFTHYPYSSYFIIITSLSIPLETWIRAPAYICWRADPFLYHTCLTFALCCAQRH